VARPLLVAPGHAGHLDWPAVGHYAVSVYGPNGFVRSFAGAVGGPAAVTATLDGHVLRLALANSGHEGARFSLVSNDFIHRSQARHVDAGETDEVSWPTQDGWYDVTVQVTSDPTFAYRFAGRIEQR
jgi:phospholipase C